MYSPSKDKPPWKHLSCQPQKSHDEIWQKIHAKLRAVRQQLLAAVYLEVLAGP